MRIGDFVSDMIPEAERESKKGGTQLWQRAMSGEPGIIVGVHVGVFRRKDGTTFPVEVPVGSIVYGGRRRISGSARDVSERRRAEERLVHQAFHDPLTGLPNRALFLDRLERALARAARAGYAAALLFLDLAGFKAVNDKFGHEAGDGCSSPWPVGWACACARRTRLRASEATSSPSCYRMSAAPARPPTWPTAYWKSCANPSYSKVASTTSRPASA